MCAFCQACIETLLKEPEYAAEFQNFLVERDWLGNLYFSTIKISKYQELSFVVKLLLTLSHDQASVECDLSLNLTFYELNILKTNMGPETVVAKQLIIGQMVANTFKPHTIKMTRSML